MQKKIISFVILGIIIFIIGVFFIGLKKSSIYDTKDLVGQKITKINLNNFHQDTIFTEKDLKKNNFILINFWASWCAPCRDEHPFLLKLKDENNLSLLGVNFKDKKNNALKFLNNFGNPYDYLTKDELGKHSVNFGVYGIPESILLNKNFVILKKFIGPLNKNDYDYIKEKIGKL
tara:strand:- start:616 stop:1140 length:525 start_codon:yes stop_codon:yes gene_type:complete